MNNTGIYKIENLVNNKVYIGQSRNLKSRFTSHKRDLMNNKHFNNYLQRSFNKYNSENFTFEVIEYCVAEELNKRENQWVLHYLSYDNKFGYNAVIPKAENDGFYHTEESKKKLSESQTVYSKDELISYLQDYYYHFNKVPTTRDLDDNENFPSSGTYLFIFGTYKEALIESDLFHLVEHKNLFERKEYSREDILNLFSAFIKSHDRFPNHYELKKPSDYNLPSEAAISRWFKGRNEIKEILNYVDVDRNKERNEALEGLRKLYTQDGKITSRTIDKSSLTRSAKYYIVNFGSLINAYELIGVDNYILPNNKTLDNHKYNNKKINKW